MTEQTIPVDTDNLEDFEALFTGKARPAEPEASKEEATSQEPEEKGTSIPEDDSLEQVETEDTEDTSVFKVKPKKTAKERIDELTAARYAAERRAEEAERLLREAQEKKTDTDTKDVKAIQPAVESAGPTPDDVDENGEPLYPLGDFDPKFIKAIVKFENDLERAEAKRAAEAERERQATESVRNELQRSWQEKVSTAEETIPDLREKGALLEQAFETIEPAYGEYLATTIMAMDHGPEVFYYLSSNLDVAKDIASLGPVAATVALGRLEAQFLSDTKEKKVKVTEAPEPPPTRARGTGGRHDVPDDTDDLAAFERKFFGK